MSPQACSQFQRRRVEVDMLTNRAPQCCGGAAHGSERRATRHAQRKHAPPELLERKLCLIRLDD